VVVSIRGAQRQAARIGGTPCLRAATRPPEASGLGAWWSRSAARSDRPHYRRHALPARRYSTTGYASRSGVAVGGTGGRVGERGSDVVRDWMCPCRARRIETTRGRQVSVRGGLDRRRAATGRTIGGTPCLRAATRPPGTRHDPWAPLLDHRVRVTIHARRYSTTGYASRSMRAATRPPGTRHDPWTPLLDHGVRQGWAAGLGRFRGTIPTR